MKGEEKMNKLQRRALSAAVMVLAAASASAQAPEFVFGELPDVRRQEVVAYIEGGGDLDVRNHKDCSLIQWAAYHGEIEIARSRLSRRASPGCGRTCRRPRGRVRLRRVRSALRGRDGLARLGDRGVRDFRGDYRGVACGSTFCRCGGPGRPVMKAILSSGARPLAASFRPGRGRGRS